MMKTRIKHSLASVLALVLALSMAVPVLAASPEDPAIIDQSEPVIIDGKEYLFCVSGDASLVEAEDEDAEFQYHSPVSATLIVDDVRNYRISLLEDHYQEDGTFKMMWDMGRELTNVSVEVVDADGTPVSDEDAAFTVAMSPGKDKNELPYFTLSAQSVGQHYIRLSATYQEQTFVRYSQFKVEPKPGINVVDLSERTDLTIQELNEIIQDEKYPCSSRYVQAIIILPAGTISAGNDGETVIHLTRPFSLEGSSIPDSPTEIQGSISIEFTEKPVDSDEYVTVGMQFQNLVLNGAPSGERSSASGIYGKIAAGNSNISIFDCTIKGFAVGISGTTTSVQYTTFEDNGIAFLIERSIGSFGNRPTGLYFKDNDIAVQLGQRGTKYPDGDSFDNPLFRLSVAPLMNCIFQNNGKNFSHSLGGNYRFFMPRNLYLDAAGNVIDPKPGDFEGNGKVSYTPYYKDTDFNANVEGISYLSAGSPESENVMLNESVTRLAMPDTSTSVEVVTADDHNNLTTLGTWSFSPASFSQDLQRFSTFSAASLSALSRQNELSTPVLDPTLTVEQIEADLQITVAEQSFPSDYTITLTIPFTGNWDSVSVTHNDQVVSGAVWDEIWGTVTFPVTGSGSYLLSGTYSVTYTDGVSGEEIFADQVYSDLPAGTATPAFLIDGKPGTPSRSGYNFTGWSPAVTDEVTGTVVYTAQWSEIYIPPIRPTDPVEPEEPEEPDETTETVTNPDGSTTTTVTDNTTGTVTETTQYENGVALEIVTSAEGDRDISVTVPSGVTQATVTIPMDQVGLGTVAVDAATGEVVKQSIPSESGLSVTLDASAQLIVVDNTKNFADTAAHWAGDAITFVTARELFNGISDTTFAADLPMSRAMLTTVLARLEGVDTTTGSTWYEAGMSWAVEQGISDGSAPDSDITREDLYTMLYRYAGSPAVSGDLSGYPDGSTVSDYAQSAMAWAVETGLCTGTGAGTLDPQGDASRAQVATILMRFMTL